MKQQLSDIELISALESRPGLIHKLLQSAEKNIASELAIANEKLINAQKIQTGFLSNIRNEIINPITALLELSSTLAEIIQGDGSKLAQLIYQEVNKLDFQLRNIIVSAEIEAGETNLIIQKCHISTLINEAVHNLEYESQKKNIRINITGSSIDFKTDSEKLSLALLNLISNGIQFSPKKENINIHHQVISDTLEISIRDFGPGISKSDQEEVFGRFTQLDSGSTKGHPGHGLGLSLTRALVEIIGGTLTIESQPNKGSTFTIKVPNHMDDTTGDLDIEMADDFLFASDNSTF